MSFPQHKLIIFAKPMAHVGSINSYMYMQECHYAALICIWFT